MKSRNFYAVLALSFLSVSLAYAMENQAQLASHYVYKVQSGDVLNLENQHVLQYDFSEQTINNSNMNKALITKSNFHRTHFQGGTWRDSQISESNWEKSQICGADFSSSAVIGSHRHYIPFGKASFQQATMQNMLFSRVDLYKATIKDTDLSYSTFMHVNMKNAVLENVDLRFSNFRKVNLKGVKFKNVNFKGAKFDRVRLRGAKIWDEETQKYRTLRGIDLLKAGASHAGFVAAIQMVMTKKPEAKEDY